MILPTLIADREEGHHPVTDGSCQFAADFRSNWYAVYTSANHEKRVQEQLLRKEVETILPLYDSVRRWKDRRVRLQLPLFPGYVFARVALCNRLPVLQTPGVVRFVSFDGSPYPLPQSEIDTLQRIGPCTAHASPHPYLTSGRRVRVNSGPLAGIEGILVRKKSGSRFVISVASITRSVAIELDAVELEPR